MPHEVQEDADANNASHIDDVAWSCSDSCLVACHLDARPELEPGFVELCFARRASVVL